MKEVKVYKRNDCWYVDTINLLKFKVLEVTSFESHSLLLSELPRSAHSDVNTVKLFSSILELELNKEKHLEFKNRFTYNSIHDESTQRSFFELGLIKFDDVIIGIESDFNGDCRIELSKNGVELILREMAQLYFTNDIQQKMMNNVVEIALKSNKMNRYSNLEDIQEFRVEG